MPSPDDGLSPLNHRSLNATLYAAEPADYFARRLRNLLLAAGNPRGLDDLLTKGVRFGSLTAGGQAPTVARTEAGATHEASDSPDDGDGEEARREAEATKSAQHFVTAEAEVLAHHVGETLLRLYLAHEFRDDEPVPACPPLDLARLRSFAEFKKRLHRRFGNDRDPEDPVNLRAVARVFHFTDTRENLLPNPPPAELWDKSLVNIEGYLRALDRP